VSGPLPKRLLGKTGELVPILGLGTACGGMGLEDREAARLFELAVDLGVTYVDTATDYDRAQKQLSHLLQRRREEIFLVTKVNCESAGDALAILERNLRDLGTDRVDLTYVHSVGGKDVDKVLAADGALSGLRDARKRGLTRYLGFSAHHAPWKSARILEQEEIDVVMFAFNPGERYTYNFEEKVLPLATSQNAGVAAMKVYGGATDMKYDRPIASHLRNHGDHDHQLALRYALGLAGVATAVIGIFNEQELRQNVEWARSFAPLSDRGKAQLSTLGKRLSSDWGPHFGARE
jgi:hypothetical protein